MNHITALAKCRALRAGCVSARTPGLPRSKHSMHWCSPRLKRSPAAQLA